MHGVDIRGLIASLFCLIVLVVGPAHGATPPPDLPHVAQRVEAQEPLHITALGSSSTEGVGATTKERCYPSRLQAILTGALPGGVTVANRGIGGQDADDMAARLPAIIAERPDLVIWQTGSNDSLRGVPLDRFVTETHDGIVQMQAAGIDVMLMEPQLSRRLAAVVDADAYRDAVRDIGRQMHVLVIRRYDMMRQWLAGGVLTADEMMSKDGLHMADGGYDLLARSVASMILMNAAPPAHHVAAR